MPEQRRALGPRGVPADGREWIGQWGCSEAAAAAASAAIWRRSRATGCSRNSLSADANLASSGGVVPVFLFNLLEHVGQHLRRAQIGAGRFDSQPGDDQERRQVLAARVALPEAPARGAACPSRSRNRSAPDI